MKIFGIGLSKTGTTSLAVAMRQIGFKVKHNPKNPYDLESAQFCNDILVSQLFKYLDKSYPNSKFIYTVRDMNSWLESCQKHFGHKMTLQDIFFYKALKFERDTWKEFYLRFDEEVKEYFEHRSQDLLILNLSDESDPWEKILTFLNLDVDSSTLPEFPRKNVTAEIAEFRSKY
ncbi:MAG: hypothetical protein KI790_02070 [Cyclobacteriaceae bacterium]|nr:hypothetical protein [Cyclobacteriaceae bacterium HetDA_MAG_MS6]